MKKKFAILSTWNGEGYSLGENKLEGIFKFKSEFFAKLKCYKKMKKEQTLDDAKIFERENGFIWEFEHDGDSGSYQAFEITDDLYGFVIDVNVNEITPCTKEEFEEEKANALAEADMDLTDEDELEEKTFFIHTLSGEYDKQFIVL